MSTYKTKNPLGSAAVKDLYDNAENVDKFVNDRTKEELDDRLECSAKPGTAWR